MNEYLNDAKFIAISPDDYDLLHKYKADELKSNPAHLGDKDAPLEVEPFFHGLPDVIIQYRRHLLTAYGGKMYKDYWRLGHNVDNPEIGGVTHYWVDFKESFIREASEVDFFNKLEKYLGV